MKDSTIETKRVVVADEQSNAPEWYAQAVKELKELAKKVSDLPSFSKEEWGKIEGMLY